LTAKARCIGKSLAELDLSELDVDVTSIRRGKERLDPITDMMLLALDVIVLRGTAESLARAEQRLLK